MLGDDINATLPGLRREAESMMTVTLRAYAPNGLTVVNGLEVLQYEPMGDTFARVQSRRLKDAAAQTVRIGGVDRPVLFGGLHLPIGAYISSNHLQIKFGDQGIGWEFACTGVGPADDPSLMGRRWLVVSAPADSFRTVRRLDVAEVII